MDDFTIGEAVQIESDGAGASLRVRRIWPDLPRFRPRSESLDDDVRVAAEALDDDAFQC